jgi:uncharacterized protein (TIGR03067 family)
MPDVQAAPAKILPLETFVMSIRRRLFVLALPLVLVASLRAADPAGADALQGRWTMLSYVDEGVLDPQFTGAVQQFTGPAYEVRKGDKVLRKGEFRIDPKQSPAHMDLKPGIGPYKGKRLEGIYRLDGDTLHTCFPEPGQPRPKQFTSEKGSGCSEVKYTRAKAE